MYMTNHVFHAAESIQEFLDFFDTSPWSERQGQPGIADMVLGNPQEMPLPGLVDALRNWSVPQNKEWFAYKLSEPKAQQVVARSLEAQTGMNFHPDDIAMTNGAFGALSTAMHALLEPGDEVVYFSPAWSFYKPIIHSARGIPVEVKNDAPDFDLNIEALDAAITPRTRIVLVNTPNNPTGRIYSPAVLQKLSSVLTDHASRNGRQIILLSDEPYRQIVFKGHRAISPANYYPNTLISYSYGKVTLAPGQRIGYLAASPSMDQRAELNGVIRLAQITMGFGFPNALLQHALPDIEQLSIDVPHIEEKRDLLLRELRSAGYDVRTPEGTFYLFPRSPIEDDKQFVKVLAEQDVFVLPGTLFDRPGYFRISLTASDEMVEFALPAFKSAMSRTRRVLAMHSV